MFLHIGNDIMVRCKEIVAVLDYNKLNKSANFHKFLNKIIVEEIVDQKRNKNKEVRTIVITKNKIFFSSIASGTIEKRMQNLDY